VFAPTKDLELMFFTATRPLTVARRNNLAFGLGRLRWAAMGLLDNLDLTKQIEEKAKYKKKLEAWQLDLLHLQPRLRQAKRNLILVFEGPDAAGKGGIIKRTLERLDPRTVRVYSIVKPTAQEYANHYLRRFWIKLPGYGEIAVFDRSWYGRVLVERVEGFATKAEWQRAYDEINQFEQTLVADGSILLKFYVHITKDEQLLRFKKRAADPYKRWKINDEDWRNREKWHQHNEAAEDMFANCNLAGAPWMLVEGNFKWYARLKVLRTVVRRLEKEVGKA
jgi:polyphosphate kinase 2 (PPK2 family)